MPYGTISEGRVTRGRQIAVDPEQFRINHYNFDKTQLDWARHNKFTFA